MQSRKTLQLPRIFSVLFLFLLSLAYGYGSKASSQWIADDEKRLVNVLFSNYSKVIRPVIDKKSPVPVFMGIALTQLTDLIEKDQILITSVWLRLKWTNSFLTWNSSHYGGIDSINVDPEMIWLPDIELYNSADGHLSDSFKKKVIIKSTGQNIWFIPVVLRSFCEVDIEYFPFDEQTCPLRFGSWTYHGFELDFKLMQGGEATDLKKYKSSGEFELVTFSADRETNTYSCCKEPYINLVFTIHFRRKMLFYVNNLIVPCILITIASLFTFILPPNTGERVTLVITTLLSLTVFMLMIAENTPTNSDVTPMIANFFMASMMEIGLALVITCLILNVYHSTRHSLRLPRFLRVLALDVLAPVLFIATPKSKKSSTSSVSKPHYSPTDTKNNGFLLTQTLREVNHDHNRHDRPMNGHVRSPAMDSPEDVIYRHQEADDNSDSDADRTIDRHVTIQCTCRGNPGTTTQQKMLKSMQYLAAREAEREKQEAVLDEWEILAKVADRFFLVLFIITITCTSLLIFTRAPRHDEKGI
ncbi:neuronal acetylcholine receptor subunit alpha-7-like [Dendronephthya gigantea]|uniref:neuronal acetylcholine receptor subunit alpha-7-like n=1 Tax=Dendronephthya gigantea TaxID=151771 RepID=UPI00106AAC74|nr:neuronal acetylcholine receptor subunit alpha-7-like [Dendronephthya gigantea]